MGNEMHTPINDAKIAPDAARDGRSDARTAGARALLVEDNELNQEVATAFLEDAGLEVDVAPDGEAAVRMVREKRYDVVLMDMQMPVMDGLTATREIRAIPGLQDLPIIAMTASAMPGDRERCLRAGMNDHVPKPIEPDVLAAKLRHWLEASRAGGPAATAGAGDLSGIRGLDYACGLGMALGRESLYLRLLSRFVSDHADAPRRISRAIDAGVREDAERVAHTLKGVAAQIGAHEIRERAQAVERAIRSHDPLEAIAAANADLERDLAPLVESISRRLPAAP